MRVVKIFIIVGLAFLLGAAGAAGYVWYLVQNALSVESPVEQQQVQELSAEQNTAVADDTSTQETHNGSTASEEGNIVIEKDSLTPGQQAVAESMGFKADSFVITPQMIACAQGKLGETRVAELVGGDQPSVLEAARLAGCL